MPASPLSFSLGENTSFQSQFHRRWGHLNDSHVRALAWLLDAPDLLDPHAPQWHGKIATLGNDAAGKAEDWLAALDRAPTALHAYLDMQPMTRLGRYAEKLMSFYFQHAGILAGHGIQVRAGKNDTIGEFDFLLRQGDDLLHWEFATKFYLLESSGRGLDADYFVGPNLADTMGAKMHKILDKQLMLAAHPAAQQHLPQPVSSAQALVKGWLFYHDSDPFAARTVGVSEHHCRGYWCMLGELDEARASRYAILNRLSWLPPAKIRHSETLAWRDLQEVLTDYFVVDTMPVMVALLAEEGDYMIETERGFIVPDDWRSRAEQRIRTGITPTVQG
jgi:hypothetical protein